jgi:protein-tyrosine-phosphatase
VDTFSLAFICTGNRFRSALAEAFVHRLTLGLPVTTHSFGTLELGDVPPLPEAIEIARSCGIDLTNHRARCVSGASLAGADLILGFDGSHVQEAVVNAAAPRDRSFTIKHFVRLLESATPALDRDPVKRARDAVAQASEARLAEPDRGAEDALRDPLGGSWNVYRDTAVEVQDLSVQLVAVLFGVSNSTGLRPISRKLRRPSASRWG